MTRDSVRDSGFYVLTRDEYIRAANAPLGALLGPRIRTYSLVAAFWPFWTVPVPFPQTRTVTVRGNIWNLATPYEHLVLRTGTGTTEVLV